MKDNAGGATVTTIGGLIVSVTGRTNVWLGSAIGKLGDEIETCPVYVPGAKPPGRIETTKLAGVEPTPGPMASHPLAVLVMAKALNGTCVTGSVLVKEIVRVKAPVPAADC